MKRRGMKQRTGVIFICDRKGIKRGRGEGKHGK
jgi:hypothetical protein